MSTLRAAAAMMRAAVEAAKTVSPATKVIAVTMLTSLGDEDLPHLGLVPPVGDQVLRLASLARPKRPGRGGLFGP
jgi:orotidine-5'-phosphate decarboxylase